MQTIMNDILKTNNIIHNSLHTIKKQIV